jgi:MFS family permease
VPGAEVNRTGRVAALLFVVAWGTNHFVPLLPLYRDRLGLSPTALAQLFGVYAVGLVPGLLLGGPLSDRVGRRRLAIPAALLAVAGTIILGAGAPTYARLLVGRLVVGLGSGATFSAATAWSQDLAAAEATPGNGARRTAIALSGGFGGGPLVASVLAQFLPHPLVVPYAVQAVVALAAIGAAGTIAPAASPVRKGAAGVAPFLPPRFLRELLPVAPWVFGFPSIAFAVLPALVRPRVSGWLVLFAGVVTAITLFSGLAVQSPLRARSPRAAGRFGVTVGLAGLLLAALAGWAVSPLAVLGAAAVLGVGYGGCLISGLRFVETQSVPAQRARATGVFYVLAYLGFAAPLILAALARQHGSVTGVLMAAALALVCAIVRWSY